MILKGSQRAGARQLAVHLLKTEENEHVEVHEVRGFVAQSLAGALNEAYAVSRGTRCKQFLFSLSLIPPQEESVPITDLEAAIRTIEDKLGLSGQPRVVVFHEKEGRRHRIVQAARLRQRRSVQMPPIEAFRDAEAYYATLAHECTHWTRHPKRLEREFGRKRWGDEGYAMEELVAELGSAFLCADLELDLVAREDHSAYIASWLKVLKNDRRAIFTAAAHAQRAVDFLHGLQTETAAAEEPPRPSPSYRATCSPGIRSEIRKAHPRGVLQKRCGPS